jgi:hypothetical protein
MFCPVNFLLRILSRESLTNIVVEVALSLHPTGFLSSMYYNTAARYNVDSRGGLHFIAEVMKFTDWIANNIMEGYPSPNKLNLGVPPHSPSTLMTNILYARDMGAAVVDNFQTNCQKDPYCQAAMQDMRLVNNGRAGCSC